MRIYNLESKQMSSLIEETARGGLCRHVFLIGAADDGVRAAVPTGEEDQPGRNHAFML